jgi:pilus assembly protein CpaC
MHFMTRALRVLFGGAFLLALTLIGTNVCHAQDEGKVIGTVIVPLGATKDLQMTTKKPIKDVKVNKPQPLAIQPAVGDPSRLLLTGMLVDQVRMILTDRDGAIEIYDVVVQIDVEYLKTQLRAAAPTAVVIPVASGNTVILNGHVKHAEDIEALLRVAGGLPNITVYNHMYVGGVQQVQVDVVVAQVTRSKARSMTFNFLADTKNFYLGSTIGQAVVNPQSVGVGGTFSTFPALLGNPGSPAGVPTNILSGVIHNSWGLLTFLEALKQEGVAKVLTEPRIVTLSGRPASYLVGGEQAIPVPAGLGQVGVQFEEFGTRLNVLPIVQGDGKIHMEIEPEVSNLDAANGTTIDGTVVPGRDTTRINTTVELESGQTFVLAGLIQHQIAGTMDKLPVLGELPFIGAAFSSKSFTDTEIELVILVTPHLVDPMDCSQVPAILPGQETRNPDDFELFLEQILEAPRGPRKVFVDHKYVAAYKNGPSAKDMPCAGGSGGMGGVGGCASGNCATGNCATGTGGAGPVAPTAAAPGNWNAKDWKAQGTPVGVPAQTPGGATTPTTPVTQQPEVPQTTPRPEALPMTNGPTAAPPGLEPVPQGVAPLPQGQGNGLPN